MGGPSREHDVSMNSGAAVLENLDRHKYDVIKIVVSKEEEWFFDDETTEVYLKPALQRLKDRQATVFLALHGNYGEDGVLQAVFEKAGIPYTGSDVLSSALAMDKIGANERYEAHNLLVPKTLRFDHTSTTIAETVQAEFELPVVIKPVSEGSSFGVSIVKHTAQLEAAITKALDCDQRIMAQAYIRGREVSCGVLEYDGKLNALPPTEIIPMVDDFFSYEAKYTDGGSQEITPAQMPDEIIETIQQNAVVAHQALGCRTYSRTDMIVADEKVYLIETNTLPGLTRHSILPQQAKVAGISFPQLLDLIIAGVQV
jgi:D-alanine-D-alanine ligase